MTEELQEEKAVEEEKKEEKVEEPKPEMPKASWIWMKNNKGESSATLTFAAVAFVVTTIVFLASMFMKIGPVELRAFDSAACAAYLTPILSLYGFRQYTDKKFGQ